MYFTLFVVLIRKPADIWSAGVLLHLLLSGTLPFMGTKDRLYNQILEAQIDFDSPQWDKIGPDAKDLLRKMLTREPDKRITIHEVLSHPWLKVFHCNDSGMEVLPLAKSFIIFAHFFQDREKCPRNHLYEVVQNLRAFNARRKLKGAILSAVSSPHWNTVCAEPYDAGSNDQYTGAGESLQNTTRFLRNKFFLVCNAGKFINSLSFVQIISSNT